MTREEAIPILHDMYNYYNDVDVDAYVGFDNEDNNAIETALETMNKYQKIVQIMERTVDDGTSMYDTLQEIEEVIEDENDN